MGLYEDLAQDASLLARWNGDANGDGTGDANDTTGNDNAVWVGTPAYSSPPPGIPGRSFVLDGTNYLAATAGVAGSADRTITGWCKSTAVRIAPVEISNGVNATAARYTLVADNLRLEIQGQGHTSGLSIADGEWHFFAVRQDGPTLGDASIRVDAVTASVAGTLTLATQVGQTWIGRAIVATQAAGELADIRIYSRALSDAELDAIYAGPPTVAASPVVRHRLYHVLRHEFATN